MRYQIIHKLEKAGATSKEKAVTIEEAELDKQEQQWLTYFAGAFLGRIKKTKDKQYYIYSPSIAKSKQDTKVVIV